MKRKKIFLATLAVVLSLGLIGVWGLFFAGKLSISADLSTPATNLVTKTVLPTPKEVVGNNSLANTDIKVDLDIQGLGEDVITNQAIEMVAVLDFTNSMNDKISGTETTKIAALKETFNNLADLFAEKNEGRSAEKGLYLGAVTYNTTAAGTANETDQIRKFDLTTDYDSLKNNIKDLTADGNTDMGVAMQNAQSLFENANLTLDNPKLITILISDGMHNFGIDPTNDNVLNWYRANDVPIYTVGFGQYTGVTDVEDRVDAALDMSDKSDLWCKDKSAPYLVTLPALPGDLPRYYCLAKDINNPGAHKLGYRLNALAIETKGQYFYAPDAATLTAAFDKIFQNVTRTTSAISVVEKFDANYTFDANQTLTVTGPRGALTKVASMDALNALDQYFVKTAENQVTFIISKGTAVKDQVIKIGFNLGAKITDQDTCIDKESYVRWGETFDYETFNVTDADKLHQETLPQYCYNLKTLSPNNPPENPTTPASPLLQTGVNILMLAIISIVLIAAIFYILALIKEK